MHFSKQHSQEMSKLLFFIFLSLHFYNCTKIEDSSKAFFTADIITADPEFWYTNQPVNFIIKISPYYPENQRYFVNYQSFGGEGKLYINDKVIANNSTIPINNQNNLTYIPLSLGEHRLVFKLNSTSGYESEIVYGIPVFKHPINISMLSSEEYYTNEEWTIEYSVTESGQTSSSLQCKYKILQGEGNLKLPEEIFPGKNQLSYYPSQAGLHVGRIWFTNQFGYSQAFDMQLIVQDRKTPVTNGRKIYN